SWRTLWTSCPVAASSSVARRPLTQRTRAPSGVNAIARTWLRRSRLAQASLRDARSQTAIAPRAQPIAARRPSGPPASAVLGALPGRDRVSAGELPARERPVRGARGGGAPVGRDRDREHAVLVARERLGLVLFGEVPEHDLAARVARHGAGAVGPERESEDVR